MAYVFARTVLPEEWLEELKKKTGIPTTKDALAEAVKHYLECPNIEDRKKV